MNYSGEMIDALLDTVQAYEQAILDLENCDSVFNVRLNWDRYGSTCRLCHVAQKEIPYPMQCCKACVLRKGNSKCNTSGDPRSTMSSLEEEIHEGTRRNRLLSAFRARLRWILKRVKENGWEIE